MFIFSVHGDWQKNICCPDAVYEKIFSVIYWLSKEEIALSRFNSLLLLLECIVLEDIKSLRYKITFCVRNIAMKLSEVIKRNIVMKIEKSKAFAVLTDEATDNIPIQS